MLLDLFKEKKCFKLVLGAGMRDASKIEKLAFLYSLAGANFFDIGCDVENLLALKKGLKRAGIEKDRYICISVGTKDDIHMQKAEINNENCKKCGKCKNACLEEAITFNNNQYQVNEQKCIGCSKCLNICSNNAIIFKKEEKNISEILPPLIELGIDCVEFHMLSDNEDEIFKKWNEIKNVFKGVLSLSIGRKKFGDEKLISVIKKMTEGTEKNSIIIQADGNPMSGGVDDFKTTLQAIACAEIIQNSKLPFYIMLSGGTNSKTSELANLCKINFNGIAIGSFARYEVLEYINRDDFYENKDILNKALKIAKNLVDVSLRYMK